MNLRIAFDPCLPCNLTCSILVPHKLLGMFSLEPLSNNMYSRGKTKTSWGEKSNRCGLNQHNIVFNVSNWKGQCICKRQVLKQFATQALVASVPRCARADRPAYGPRPGGTSSQIQTHYHHLYMKPINEQGKEASTAGVRLVVELTGARSGKPSGSTDGCLVPNSWQEC